MSPLGVRKEGWEGELLALLPREALLGGSTHPPQAVHSSVGKESACTAGDPVSIPGLGKSPGEGNGNPLQYSCL